MTSSTRIEVLGGDCVVAVPLRVHPAFIPHVVLIAFIALAWTADGVFELVRWVVS